MDEVAAAGEDGVDLTVVLADGGDVLEKGLCGVGDDSGAGGDAERAD